MTSGDVIITITLNAALYVRYEAAAPLLAGSGTVPVTRPAYRAGGRGITAARLLHAFGHEVLAAGLAGGQAGELIAADLSHSGVPAAFTWIRAESRRILEFSYPGGSCPARFAEPGPYITTEELGRFAAEFRGLLASAAAIVLSGSLPDGLPPDMYAALVRYATEAGVPVIVDAGGQELIQATRNRPALVVAEAPEPDAAADLLRLGAEAAAVLTGRTLKVATADARWTAGVSAGVSAPVRQLDRGALVAGLIPGTLLGWSWPDRLRNALALAAGPEDVVDPDSYEELLDRVHVTEGTS